MSDSDRHTSGLFQESFMVTLHQHIMEQQASQPGASGEFSWLLSGIIEATQIIAAKVRRAGLTDILGQTGGTNVHGETVQRLDIFANDLLIKCLAYRGNAGILASEENEEPLVIHASSDQGKYIVLFDPLDGSSNIDVNVSIGTIFSILERPPAGTVSNGPVAEILQPGTKQRAAGYVIYGPSTVLVYTTGQGVHMFTLEPSSGTFILHREHVRMPESGAICSVNESNFGAFPEPVQRYLLGVKASSSPVYTSRYVGSFVADFHRTLLKGGIFMYPQTAAAPKGKLRLMYECNPMAFISEQAGGLATDGQQRILDIVPETLHQRTPLFIGSKREVEGVLTCIAAAGA